MLLFSQNMPDYEYVFILNRSIISIYQVEMSQGVGGRISQKTVFYSLTIEEMCK
jgi:hypothetical protein